MRPLSLFLYMHARIAWQRSSSSSSNAFRAAVASCVDADAHDDRPTMGSAKTSGRGPKATEAVAADKAGLERVASRVGGGRDSGHGGAAGAPAPMRISFRGMFEAFAATLEASPSRSRGGRGTGSYSNGGKKGVLDGQEGANVEGVGREGVALLLYSILQVRGYYHWRTWRVACCAEVSGGVYIVTGGMRQRRCSEWLSG